MIFEFRAVPLLQFIPSLRYTRATRQVIHPGQLNGIALKTVVDCKRSVCTTGMVCSVEYQFHSVLILIQVITLLTTSQWLKHCRRHFSMNNAHHSLSAGTQYPE